MKRLIILAALSAAHFTAAGARAQADNMAVPTFQLSGSTSGKGQITAGVEFRSSRSVAWDVFIGPAVSVANTDGAAGLISFTTKDGVSGPVQPSLSVSATFAYTNPDRLRPSAELKREKRREHEKATFLCVQGLGASAPSAADAAFARAYLPRAATRLLKSKTAEDAAARKALLAEAGRAMTRELAGCSPRDDGSGIPAGCDEDKLIAAVADALGAQAAKCRRDEGAPAVCAWLEDPRQGEWTGDRGKLCDAGAQRLDSSPVMQRVVKELPEVLYPDHLISLGASAGAAKFEYVESVDGKLGTTSVTHPSVSGNALYTFVQSTPKNRWTFELPVGFKLSWKQSDRVAHKCKASLGKLDDYSVSECEQKPLGAPTKGLKLDASAHVGLASIAGSELWRIAVGPTFMYDFATGASTTYQVGGQLPIYFSLTEATGVHTEYQGLVRITPAVLAERVDGKVGANVGLTVSLLGKRKMFGSGLFFP